MVATAAPKTAYCIVLGASFRMWKTTKATMSPPTLPARENPILIRGEPRAFVVVATEFCRERRMRQPKSRRECAVEHGDDQIVDKVVPLRVRSSKLRHQPEHQEEARKRERANDHPRQSAAPRSPGVIRKPADQRIVNCVPDSGYEQNAASQSRVHSSDVGEKDELEKDDRASRHGRPQLARTIGQTFRVPELGRVLPRCNCPSRGFQRLPI